METEHWVLIIFLVAFAPFLTPLGKRLPKWFRYGVASLLVLGVFSVILWLVFG